MLFRSFATVIVSLVNLLNKKNHHNHVIVTLPGAYVIASTLDILIGTEATILANYPKLQLFYTTMISTKAFDGIRDYTTYFTK